MAGSVRDYAILYVGGRRAGGSSIGGGKISLNAGQHALDGPEHSSPADSTRLDASTAAHGLLPKLSGVAAERLDGDGEFRPVSADEVTYDNGTSGLGAIDAQSAIDELAAAGAGGTVPWLWAQADLGLAGDGVTDDAAALEAAIDTATASGTQSCWIRFEPGTYLISRALQSTGTINAQIRLPTVATTDPQITIRLTGAARPPFAYHGTALDASYSILKSSLAGASGTAAVVSGGNSGQNNIELVIEDLVCTAPDNPTFTFWNIATTQGGKRDGLFISTVGVISGASVTQPSNTNAYGIKLPGTNNSNLTEETVICVYGFYTGILHGELGQANYITSLTMVGVEVPTSPHSGGYIRHQMTASPIGIKFTGGANYLDIWYDAEHCNPAAGGPYNPAWAVTTYDVSDPSDYFHGDIRWFCVQAGVGADHLFTVDGGANSSNAEIGPLTAMPSAPTGELGGTWATSTVDATHSGSAHADFIAKAIVDAKGDLIAATAADTVARVAVGTDGQYLKADSGAPAGVSWATVSAAGGEILISDTPSTPLIFADLLQNEAQDDLLYSD